VRLDQLVEALVEPVAVLIVRAVLAVEFEAVGEHPLEVSNEESLLNGI